MKKQVIGILAHVDAGKTTLSEALLFTTGKIKKLGRVDSRNTFLDTHEIERERGITIFSKQAILDSGELRITLIDTPGHVDFSTETERTLSVLDYAILVISGSEGVQAHTETLWDLLDKYKVPTFVFVTKMDLRDSDKNQILADLKSNLSSSVIDFTDTESDDFIEQVAMCNEELFESYMNSGEVENDEISRAIAERCLFPCLFGSGLKLDGVAALYDILGKYTVEKKYGERFAAKIYKIGHDISGTRLSYMKITGGRLSVRDPVKYITADGEECEEKVSGIRFYSGAKFEAREFAEAGDICAVIGMTETYAGQGLGDESCSSPPYLEPVLGYKITLPKDADPRIMLEKLRLLEEEEPLLHIVWNERYGEINAQVMGQVQTEVLVRLISDRFGVDISFDDGRIMYKETITAPVEGVGHFEPLRHYAEVHLLMEPLEIGRGLIFDTKVSENLLDRNWQRLILTHLEEKTHLGVLTGSPITDMKITLVAGRAHLKHTVGGDFRESTYRAVRHGLMCARESGKCTLLEPYYEFRLELPGECVGRAISDIVAREGTFEKHEAEFGTSVLVGRAPVSTIGDYAAVVASYTHGKGRFSYRFGGYYPCHNADEVIESFAYDPEADIDNTPDSVFCAKGAGFVVPWREVTGYMHLESLELTSENVDAELEPREIRRNISIDEKELESIMEREFGPIRRKVYGKVKEQPHNPDVKQKKYKRSLYIIDGYNVIFAWDELSAIAEVDLDNARRHLCDILVNYHGFTKKDIIVVFDAYNVKGAVERKIDYHGLHVVFTKEGELGDTYIEKLVSEIGKDYSVRVITSDALIQLQAVRSGVLRMSAREFREEVTAADLEIEAILNKLRSGRR